MSVHKAQSICPLDRDRVRFNMMVVGESGLGKTTFLMTLFKRYIDNNVNPKKVDGPFKKTVSIKEVGRFKTTTSNNDGVDGVLYDSFGYGDFVGTCICSLIILT
jgi:septin family protein